MEKIPTIFERDWDGNRGVIDKFIGGIDYALLNNCIPTEKLDGTNVRLTVRNHMLVRVEKRRNPNKIQKHKGIVDPWYVDACESDPGDKWIMESSNNTFLAGIPDGEWSGEAIGFGIQGNPLCVKNMVVPFSLGLAPVLGLEDCSFKGIKKFVVNEKSKINPDVPIEGVVWRNQHDGSMYKIKAKDFK